MKTLNSLVGRNERAQGTLCVLRRRRRSRRGRCRRLRVLGLRLLLGVLCLLLELRLGLRLLLLLHSHRHVLLLLMRGHVLHRRVMTRHHRLLLLLLLLLHSHRHHLLLLGVLLGVAVGGGLHAIGNSAGGRSLWGIGGSVGREHLLLLSRHLLLVCHLLLLG